MTQEVILKLKIQMPEEMYVEDLKAYVKDAVSSWSGGGDPEGPLFGWFHKEGRLIVTTYRRQANE